MRVPSMKQAHQRLLFFGEELQNFENILVDGFFVHGFLSIPRYFPINLSAQSIPTYITPVELTTGRTPLPPIRDFL